MQPHTPPKPPITVKAYGLMPFTKSTYLMMQPIVIALSIACFAASLYFNLDELLYPGAHRLFVILFGLALVGEVIELIAMLWRFHVRERQEASRA